jgi:hypothetical protein
VASDLQYVSRGIPTRIASCNQDLPDMQALETVLVALQPRMILDLGTRLGGTTLMMHETVSDADLWSFDFNNAVYDGTLNQKVCDIDRVPWPKERVALATENAAQFNWFGRNVLFFRLDFTMFAAAVKTMVRAYLDQKYRGRGRLFVYVDGFIKTEEALLYRDLLHPGEVMGIHDFGSEWGLSDLLPHATDLEEWYSDIPRVQDAIEKCEYTRFFRKKG